MVEAFRAGYLIARSKKAASAWATRRAQSPGGKGLKGKALDSVVSLLAAQNPANVRLEN